jgi:hypothetical protein
MYITMHTSYVTPSLPCRPQINSLVYSLPIRRLKEVLSRAFPGLTLTLVEEVPSIQLVRLYTITMSDGRKLFLSYAPSPTARLLRQETTMLSSEASLLHFITSKSQHEDDCFPERHLQLSATETRMMGLLPKLVKHSSDSREMGYPYSIFEAASGAPLSTLSIYLSLSERQSVDREVGALARALASITSPTGMFGPVNRVQPDQTVPGAETLPSQEGFKTWSEGFNLLLEGVLRDGEDMAVLIPYETVRAHYKRISWRLDAVKTSRLLILDIGTEANIMVERGAEGSSSEEARMTGLRSWSMGIFGDPLLSNCFEEPSEGFLEGWKGGDEIIEDMENKAIRIMLYRCFRALVSIITEYYRPQGDSSRRELDGRRKLTRALADLGKVDVAVSDDLKRVRSVSKEAEATEAEGSKKQKVDMSEHA